jgi:bacillithiol biosynthesis deacetylase BshB1
MPIDLLVFGAHPDDAELGCGGTLLKAKARGYRTAIVDLTRGELGTRGTAETRRLESQSAAAALALDERITLDLPDGAIAVDGESKRKVVEALRRLRPKVVIAPHTVDFHPDHANAGTLITEAFFLAKLEKYPADGEPHLPARLLYYPAHDRVSPTIVVDISAFFERKLEVVRCYRSQLFGAEGGDPETRLSRKEFLEIYRAAHIYYGFLAGCRYGEPFLVRSPLWVDDPVALFAREAPHSP